MNKILLIIRREYLSRVKKKSFIIMTLVTPLIIAGFYGLIIYFSITGADGLHDKIAVVNNNKTLTEKLVSGKNLTFTYVDNTLEELKPDLKSKKFDYVLVIPEFPIDHPAGIELFGEKQAGLALNSRVSDNVEEAIRVQKLKESGIQQETLDKLKTSVSIDNKKIADTGDIKDSSAGASTIIAFVAGIMMFMFILLYGIQVMRGVIEEKTSRIIEIMISSVKPFQLMMGKIIGIAMVGLTQFILWIILSVAISTVVVTAFVDKKAVEKTMTTTNMKGPGGVTLDKKMLDSDNSTAVSDANPMTKIQKSIESLELGKIITVFLFYFLAGYLFYSALYAAIGSAVDSETETQQFMLPVMMPLLLGYSLSLSVVVNDPGGTLAFWLSMIPFTSPIAMVVRIPYGVPGWQLALSMGILILGFIGTVWLASKIYRVGILMYGKKASFKEMLKWFAYRN